MKQLLVIVLGAIWAQPAVAAPPEPPLGKRWILNSKFSDEFDGTTLDSTKWFDHHPTWEGRPPGIFLPSQVAVKNGFLSIKGAKLEKERVVSGRGGKTTTYTVAGGAVVSKTTDAYLGYYESRFKAAKTTMSTTFWLSSRGNYAGPKGCGDSYGLELDIQECIGRTGDFKGAFFAKGMNSNSHFWYTDCQRERHDLRAPQATKEMAKWPSEDFHTYGGWWQDESTVSYYLDNELTKSVNFNTSVKPKPFDNPMGLNLVSETYPFPWISLPTDEELRDDTRNTAYYDWVRSYILVGVDDPAPTEGSSTNIAKTSVFDETVRFTEKPTSMTSALAPAFEISYMSNADREIYFELRDESNAVVAKALIQALGGYGKRLIKPVLNRKLDEGKVFVASSFIRPSGSAGNKEAWKSDSFRFQSSK